MKSKTLYSKLIRENIRRQKWVTAIISLAMFLLYPVMAMMETDKWINAMKLKHADQVKQFAQFFVGNGGYSNGHSQTILLAAVLLGALSAVSGFSYLHSKNKVDFYHSLPIKREKLFLLQGISGVICFIVPSLTGMVLMMVIGGTRGLFSAAALWGALSVWGISILFFILAYETGVLAMLLTGRILVGILGTSVFLVYAVLIDVLAIGYSRSFYYTISGSMGQMFDSSRWFSLPAAAVYAGRQMTWGRPFGLSAALSVPAIVLLGLLCIWLYRKRPSEAAGRSMAFRRAGDVIKILMVVPASLAVGLIFLRTINIGSDFWLVFGLLFGLFIFYGIVQMIYQMDFRSVLGQKHHLLIAAVAVGVIAAIFRFDLTGYNTYLPKQEDIQDINIYTAGFYPNGTAFSFQNGKEILDEIHMGNSDGLYNLAQKLVTGAKNYNDNGLAGTDGEYMQVAVQYNLANGKKASRTYTVYPGDFKEDFEALLSDKSSMDMVCPLRIQDISRIKNVAINMGYEQEDFPPEKAKSQQKFLEALQRDLQNMDGRIISEEAPVGFVSYMYKFENDTAGYNEEYMMAYIYRGFTETKKVMQELGIDMQEGLPYEDVRKVTISTYDDEGEVRNVEKTCTSPEEIAQIMPKLIQYDLISLWTEVEDEKNAEVETRNGSYYYLVLK